MKGNEINFKNLKFYFRNPKSTEISLGYPKFSGFSSTFDEYTLITFETAHVEGSIVKGILGTRARNRHTHTHTYTFPLDCMEKTGNEMSSMLKHARDDR